MNQKQWKCNQHLIKMNFGAKKFSEKFYIFKNKKSPTFHHHPGLALKRLKGCETYWTWTNGAVSGVKTFIFSSAPWKTTKNTYISIIRQIWKKPPQKGVSFSPKCPRGTRTRILPRSTTVVLYLVQLPPYFDQVSRKKQRMDQML